jgi:hypothetical protein
MKILHQTAIGLLLFWLAPLTVGTLVFLAVTIVIPRSLVEDDALISVCIPPTVKQLHKRRCRSHAL